MSRREVDAELIAELVPLLDAVTPTLGRVPWLPRLVADDGGDLGTRYGARPWIGFGFAWPACPQCREPLAFFVQLDLATLPTAFDWPHRAGLVQLFYCTNAGRYDRCGVDPTTWVVRHVPAERTATTGAARSSRARDDRMFGWQPQRVIEWERGALELPGYEEGAWEAIDWYDDVCYDAHEVARVRDVAPRTGDKLGGWPNWVQSPEYPPCAQCRVPMEYLLQIECNGATGWQFGDLGAGYLLQCRTHVDSVGFVWACH